MPATSKQFSSGLFTDHTQDSQALSDVDCNAMSQTPGVSIINNKTTNNGH